MFVCVRCFSFKVYNTIIWYWLGFRRKCEHLRLHFMIWPLTLRWESIVHTWSLSSVHHIWRCTWNRELLFSAGSLKSGFLAQGMQCICPLRHCKAHLYPRLQASTLDLLPLIPSRKSRSTLGRCRPAPSQFPRKCRCKRSSRRHLFSWRCLPSDLQLCGSPASLSPFQTVGDSSYGPGSESGSSSSNHTGPPSAGSLLYTLWWRFSD